MTVRSRKQMHFVAGLFIIDLLFVLFPTLKDSPMILDESNEL